MLTLLFLMAVLLLASPFVVLVVRVLGAVAKIAWGLLRLLALLAVAATVCVGAIAFAVWWCFGRRAARARPGLAKNE